jgi:hypothetical protein
MEQNLYRWAVLAAAELGTPGWTGDRDTVAILLDFSREAAHRVARPAAPVTTFIAGVAVGLAGAGSPDELRRAVETLLAALPPEAPAEQ